MRAVLVPTLLLAAALTGCLNGGGPGAGQSTETFQQAGSSTVLPVAQAWAEEFPGGAQFVVSGGGTGAGFKQFCRGEIDVADASRPIKDAEKQECAAAGVTPFEIQVAIDGLAVVVPKSNTFVDHLSVEELNKIWTADAGKQAKTWADVRAGWPAEALQLYGPGPDSGTFDYFVEVIIHPFDGNQSKGRSDYTPSEDDNILVQGVSRSPYGLGYFGLAYYEENADKLRAVPIVAKGATEPVEPTAANVEAGRYKPLARPIDMYTDGAPTGTLREYFEWGLGDEGQALVEDAGYIKLPAPVRDQMLAKVRGG